MYKVVEQPKEQVNPQDLAAYKRYKESRLLEYLRLDLTALPHSTVTCLICKKSMPIPNKDDFDAYSVWVTDVNGFKRRRLLKTNKEALAHFQGVHWESCIRWYKGGGIV